MNDNRAKIARREMLAALAGLGVGTAVFHRALAARAATAPKITPEMVEQAEWISGLELSEEDRVVVNRARRAQRFLTQPFFSTEQFTNIPGRYVDLAETLRGFREILEGKHDDVPEQAFYMVGTIDEALAKAERLAEESRSGG